MPGEELVFMYFSLSVERKVPKERHPRKGPTVPSLGIHPPDLRDTFASRRKCLIARMGRQDPNARTNGGAPSARQRPFILPAGRAFDGRRPYFAE